ncbi:TlpA family protein disulfide reductase [Chryseobacterium arthrosphaerae]|uniref:TlpA family protein disulfide reductase n=1 Tax=Chryseobacterium arthrosphaerae TaxID=651561 RepID=UPI000F4D700B|nr:TlpA disulfide reductase family protein [Chryseobacterium arthrosphaerae]AYZ14137.1 TlpA family protein disulfide reductase [Chryseobacterium arthrosphaerae]
MKLKSKLKILVLIIGMIPLHLMAQSTPEEVLKGLKKSEKKLERFDGESVPVYLPDGKRVRGGEMMEAVMKGDYAPEQYEDEKGNIKAIMLRQLSEEEIAMVKSKSKKRAEKQSEIKPSKDFTVVDMNGKSYSIKELKGKTVVINFWYTRCKPCLMEMPELNELVDKYSEKGVVFLGITFDDKKVVKNFLSKKAFKYNIIPNARDIISLYEISNYPSHIIIDENSNIVFSATGLEKETVANLDNYIAKLTQKP